MDNILAGQSTLISYRTGGHLMSLNEPLGVGRGWGWGGNGDNCTLQQLKKCENKKQTKNDTALTQYSDLEGIK